MLMRSQALKKIKNKKKERKTHRKRIVLTGITCPSDPLKEEEEEEEDVSDWHNLSVRLLTEEKKEEAKREKGTFLTGITYT